LRLSGHRLYWTHLQGIRDLPKLAGTLAAPMPVSGNHAREFGTTI
jgi:hypothetical protein